MVVTAAPANGLRRLLVQLAATAPVRVFVMEGIDPPADLVGLRLREGARLVDSPRSANVLLVAGRLPAPLHEPARRVHDMMPHPRSTVRWLRALAVPEEVCPFSRAMVVGPHEDVVQALRQVQGDLLTTRRVSDVGCLPDEEPAPWRGVGPYGQGGKGMTGGVPYGRPMAERAPDRDGLELDQLPIRIGPFFPPFPTGLVLDVRTQGDVIQEVTVAANPFRSDRDATRGGRVVDTDPFRRALLATVPIAELELARARHHLRWFAHALRVHGLETLGRRALALVPALRTTMSGEILALRRLLERTRGLGWSTAGVGLTARERVAGRGLGPVARAAGLVEDARLEEPAYRQLGFEPVVHREGDARDRWRQRLLEAVQSLDLAARAGDRRAGGAGRVEAPRGLLHSEGGPVPGLLALVPHLLQGMEWGDAVTTVVSLDIDLRDPITHGVTERAGTTDAAPSETD